MMGASALEDKLALEVPECISDFRRAGINVWMITGDKLETAEHIGYSCSFFDADTHLFRIKDFNEQVIKQKLQFIYEFDYKTTDFKFLSEFEDWFVEAGSRITTTKQNDHSQSDRDFSFYKHSDLNTPIYENNIGLIIEGHCLNIIV